MKILTTCSLLGNLYLYNSRRDMEAKTNSYATALSANITDIKNLTVEIEAYSKVISQLKESEASLSSMLSILHEQLSREQAKQDQDESLISSLQAEIELKETNLERVKAELQTYETKVDDLQFKIADLEKQARLLSDEALKKTAEIEKITLENSKLKEEKVSLIAENTEYKNTNSNLETENVTLTQNNSSMQQRIISLEEELDGLRNENESLKGENNDPITYATALAKLNTQSILKQGQYSGQWNSVIGKVAGVISGSVYFFRLDENKFEFPDLPSVQSKANNQASHRVTVSTGTEASKTVTITTTAIQGSQFKIQAVYNCNVSWDSHFSDSTENYYSNYIVNVNKPGLYIFRIYSDRANANSYFFGVHADS